MPRTNLVKKRAKPPRGIRPFSTKIIALRKLKQWTQEELAKHSGWDTRTVSRAETESPIKLDALASIATALNVTYLEIAVPDFMPGDNPQHWLDEMVASDLAGDFYNARRFGEALVQHLLFPKFKQPELHLLYMEASVRLAIVCNHQQEWERAIEVLNDCLLNADAGDPSRGWAIYQRGLIQRGFAEHLRSHTNGVETPRIQELLRLAEEDLQSVQDSPTEDLAVAAAHQLGVVWLLRSKILKALEIFEECLRRRQSASPDSELAIPYRLGYEYRRLAQCYSLLAQGENASDEAQKLYAESARKNFDEARRLAEATAHQRLLRDLDRDCFAWDIRVETRFRSGLPRNSE